MIWTCFDEIFLVMRKSRRSGILFVSVGHTVCGLVCGKVVEVVGYYAVEEVFASYCNQSATPLGVFSVVVSSGYASVAQGVQEVVEVFFGDGVSGRAVYI